MLTQEPNHQPGHPSPWLNLVAVAEKLVTRSADFTERQNAYHLQLGAMAAVMQNLPCTPQNITAIPEQLANTAKTGAIIAHFVAAARATTIPVHAQDDGLHALALKTLIMQRHLDKGGALLKDLYRAQYTSGAEFYPEPLAILTTVRQEVPEYPDRVLKLIHSTIETALPK